MTEKEKASISKFISLVLRHEPQRIGIMLDCNGWADTSELIEKMNISGQCVTIAHLKEIVETNNKKRFKFNDDYTKIRASQGHSISVDVELKEAQPPDLLYHGTATRFIDSIKTEGLIAKSRLYVHLSADTETALNVGKRHGKPIVLTVDSGRMFKDGFEFYLSENNVWLTMTVPIEYIRNA